MNVSRIGPTQHPIISDPAAKSTSKAAAREPDAVILDGKVRVDELVQAARDLPETRPEQMEKAKRRVQNGHYDTEEVRHQTAENILKSGALGTDA